MDLNSLLESLTSMSITIPKSFHSQVNAIKKMMIDDMSGLVQSLVDFYIDTASSVDYEFHTGNDNLDSILNDWLSSINLDFNGIVPSGVKALAEEYFKERWANSSFICLKILDWKQYGSAKSGLLLPSKIVIADGGLIYADIKENETIKIDDLPEYYYGNQEKEKAEKLDKGVYLYKPFDRWFDIYPVPFLVRRGVLHNYLFIKTIKEKQSDILYKIIDYFLMIKRGTDSMVSNPKLGGYAALNESLKAIKDDMQTLINDLAQATNRVPLRITTYDEEIMHMIPEFEKFMKPILISSAEKGILSGLGWIDVPDSAMSSRRESIINPKPAMEEVKKGIRDFKAMLSEIVRLALMKNKKEHTKYASKKPELYNTSIMSFLTKDAKDHLRSLYDRGLLSKQTYLELVGDAVYVIEKFRREKEAKNGDEILMYPPIIVNSESDISDLESVKNAEFIENENVSEDKKGIEKQNYQSSLEGSPYKTVNDLPEKVRKNIKSIELKRAFLQAFNNAYNEYLKRYGDKKKAETLAFKTAWSVVKKMGKKTKDGWILKEGDKNVK